MSSLCMDRVDNSEYAVGSLMLDCAQYKPRTQPGKCNVCGQKNIMAAYHTICTKCAGSENEIMAMLDRSSESDRQHDESNPANEPSGDATPRSSSKATPKSLRRIRVCAMCTNCPALSKYSNASPEDIEIVEELQRLEDMVEDGVHSDGHRLTLRETKSLERKIEKLQEELKERKRSRGKEDGAVDGDGGEDERADNTSQDGGEGTEEEEEDQECDSDVDDPFLKLTGGKALVGEEYQKMLLQKQEMAGMR